MSVKKDVIIQADDIVIIQGEKVKNYNVILTSQDGTTLAGRELTIAFYNNNYTFEMKVETNWYGVASVPLYLCGDAWSVDVHFKGDRDYNPQVVTRKIAIEKFETLGSYITSENLSINIDETSMNGTYYTIHLFDIYDRPIVNEPVSIVVSQTGVDEPQIYIDMVLKTDKDGKIEVPFLSHDENVQITTQYYGCTRYKPCINADIVSFVEVEPRNDVEFRYRAYDYGHHELSWRINGGDWAVVQESDWNIVKPYINIPNDNRNVYDGWFYVESLKDGTYKLTLCYYGALENTYPFCRTFTYTEPTDMRKSLSDWIEMQGGSNDVDVEIDTNYIGSLAHIKFEFDYELPCQITRLTLQGGASYMAIPKYEYADDGFYKKTILEYDIIVFSYLSDTVIDYNIYQGTNLFINVSDYYISQLDVEDTGIVSPSALIVTGFGANSETYQSINVISPAHYHTYYRQLNRYYIMKIFNRNTLEEFYFYSYLIDDVTPVHNEFQLAIGTWDYDILSKDCVYYGFSGGKSGGSATLTVNSEITPPSSTIIAQSENYIDLGTDSPTFANNTISTATTDDDIHSIMALEFTNSNYYKLQFNDTISGNDSTIIFGADPNLETNDGLYINPNNITLWNDDIEMDTVIFDTPILNQGNNIILIQRYGTTVTVFANDTQVYQTDLLSWNTFGVYQDTTGSTMTLSTFSLEPYVVTDITPSTADYDGTVFGSNIHLEIDDNKLNMIDYGMLPQGAVGSGKIILNDVPLESANKYAIQLEMKYNNSRFERLNNLTGQMQMRVYEDILSTDTVKDYEKTLCSPMPVPNSRTVFTRHSDEGTLYFVQDPLNANSSFLTNAYNQYKGGVEITTETGISLFNLDNAYSPVYVGNELVRAEFHRRSGFIRLARYDETSGDWVNVNTLKLRNYPQLSLNKYNDDYAEIQFGNTVWKFYRGRPFIVLNHSKDDLRIMNLVDRVYCETVENQRGMGFIVDENPNEQTTVTDENGTVLGNYSTFNPQLSIQQFKQELHIGENIRLDNFELYEADSNQNIGDVATDSQLGILNIDNDNALQIYKEDTDLALNFPSYSHYVERVNDTFTLSIDYLDCPFENIKIKARGFDEKGAVPVKENIQYGIWEQTVDVEVDTTATDSVRATFTGCPSEVKYLDFVIFFTGANSTDIVLKDLMYYDGDAIINHDIDTSRLYAEQVTINFADTYFANIYNDKDSYGLCIARPYQEPFTLTTLSASSETVFIPYMKNATEWDKASQVFLEYLNAKKQIIDIDWEN